MLLKLGVDISRLKRPIRRALKKLEDLYTYNKDEFVITSTYEGDHGANSLHYSDEAIDGRKLQNKTGPETKDQIKHILGKDFDVLYHRNHIHIEYDPK